MNIDLIDRYWYMLNIALKNMNFVMDEVDKLKEERELERRIQEEKDKFLKNNPDKINTFNISMLKKSTIKPDVEVKKERTLDDFATNLPGYILPYYIVIDDASVLTKD